MMGRTKSPAGVGLACLAAALVCTPAAQAHSTSGASGSLAGFLHPLTGLDHLLTGLDHLLAMLAVGAWGASIGGRAVWALPLAFVTGMAGGGVVAALGVQMPGVELMIAASVVVLGFGLAGLGRSWRGTAGPAAFAGVFAVFHGHAHVAEMTPGASAAGYAAAMLVSTSLLHAAGASATLVALRADHATRFVRVGGAVVTVIGAALAFGLV